MEMKDLALSLAPPTIAIALEFFNPFDADYYERQANVIVDKELGYAPQAVDPEIRQRVEAARQLIRHAGEGAGSLVGIAPTILSFLVSSLALIVLLDRPTWWMFGVVIAIIIGILPIWKSSSKRSLSELSTWPIEAGPFRGMKLTTLCSRLIYSLNVLLILIAAGIFVATPRVASPSPASGATTVNRS